MTTDLDHRSRPTNRSIGTDAVSQVYGNLGDGTAITRHVLTGGRGLRVSVIDYGAAITAVEVPDKRGQPDNVVLGFGDLSGYLTNTHYIGAICGRYANRIAGGRFTVDGAEYQLTINERVIGPHGGANHLHGGSRGFDKVVWTSRTFATDRQAGAILAYTSPDGDEGYPGQVTATVQYTVNDNNELIVAYKARATRPTPINLTHHGYWNLGGSGCGDVLGHQLTLHCDRYLPVNRAMIPTGELAAVANTPMDFRRRRAIGKAMEELGGGFDSCFAIAGPVGTLRSVATVRHPESGRVMTIRSTESGVQFYTANSFDSRPASGGFARHRGLCLECGHFPDSPNQPHFPATIVRPGQVYSQITIHRFAVE
ncbi:MAG: galactose mutarotase [Proteobacteria bacterium]|nr:galactose mutarotase [Pseudomonadota bacterium]